MGMWKMEKSATVGLAMEYKRAPRQRQWLFAKVAHSSRILQNNG